MSERLPLSPIPPLAAVGQLPPDLHAAFNGAVSLAQNAETIRVIVGMPGASRDLAEIVANSEAEGTAVWEEARAAIQAVSNELASVREGVAKFGSIVQAHAHLAAMSLFLQVSGKIKLAVDMEEARQGRFPVQPWGAGKVERETVVKHYAAVRTWLQRELSLWPDGNEIIAEVTLEASKAAEKRLANRDQGGKSNPKGKTAERDQGAIRPPCPPTRPEAEPNSFQYPGVQDPEFVRLMSCPCSTIADLGAWAREAHAWLSNFYERGGALIQGGRDLQHFAPLNWKAWEHATLLGPRELSEKLNPNNEYFGVYNVQIIQNLREVAQWCEATNKRDQGRNGQGAGAAFLELLNSDPVTREAVERIKLRGENLRGVDLSLPHTLEDWAKTFSMDAQSLGDASVTRERETADRDQGMRNQDGGEPTEGDLGGTADADMNPEPSLAPSRRIALNQYSDALSKNPDLINGTDREVYEWIASHSDGDPLPSLETWSRYLREARNATGTNEVDPKNWTVE